jgi:ribosomal 30S subunit maturation factor RimM
MTEQICVGAIAGSYGVRGEVRLKSFCAIPEDIEAYSPLSNEDGTQSYTLVLVRAIKNGFTARVGGVETKEQADALKGLRLFAPRVALCWGRSKRCRTTAPAIFWRSLFPAIAAPSCFLSRWLRYQL